MNPRQFAVSYFLIGTFTCLFVANALPTESMAQVNEPPFVEQFLIKGELGEGEKQLQAKLVANPNDDQSRFELGVLQFFQSIEHLAQSMYEFGPESNIGLGFIPFLRMPVPNNPDPEEVKLEDVRKAIAELIDDLNQTNETLGKIKANDVKLPLHLFKFRFDLDNDGKVGEHEKAHDIFQRYLGIRQRANQDLGKITIDFDRSDVEWLRGYCNLLQAMCETVLAYDQTELWDTIAHRIFKNPVVRHKFFIEEKKREGHNDRPAWNDSRFYFYIADVVAAVDNCDFKLKEPQRLKKAHGHLLSMIQHSRKMWKFIAAETDRDNEWIPSSDQTNPFVTQRITLEMTQSWALFLNESEELLNGKKLIPFWRGTNPKRGINLHKVFHEPVDLDLVDWIQGPGMIPFLQEGQCTQPETWQQFQRTFRGNFVGFAIWFN